MPCTAARAIVPILCLTLASHLQAAPPAPKEVDGSIKKGVAWLYSKQNQKGHWESAEAPEGNIKGADRNKPTGGQWGGHSAIAAYALLDCGEPWTDDRIKKALEWLNRAQITGTYAVSLRANVWQYLPESPNIKRAADRDAYLLLGGMKTRGDADGFWGYALNEGNSGWYDHSTSQFALLGVYACQQAGREVPTAFWKKSETAWSEHQHEDGSWGYRFVKGQAPEPRLSMTLAGVATLFLAQDYTRISDGVECKGNVFDDRLVRGTKYVRDNFQAALTPGGAEGRKYYTLYGVERVAMASGFKYFGDIDWYTRGAEVIIKQQSQDGSWGSIPDTAFALIFLSRGRAPVILNKLEYELEAASDSGGSSTPITGGAAVAASNATTGNWHQRPRDVAVITKWIGNSTERKLNWQIVSNRAKVDDLHDAPVLYISGNQKLNFPEDTVAKLRQYIEEGGLVFGNADCSHKDFASTFVELGRKMFPRYEFRELPADHPIYTLQPFRRSQWKNPPSVLALSNGVRELMIFSPNLDFARYWQTGNFSGRPEAYQLMANIVLYTVDRQNLKYKGGTHVVRAASDSGELPRNIRIARLDYQNNWNPEPAGWPRLAAILKNQKQADLTTDVVKLGDAKLDNAAHIAHLTGTTGFTLTKDQVNELRRFVTRGGTILADAAGGHIEFSDAALNQLEPLISGAKFENIPPNDPILAAIKDKNAPAVAESMMAPNPIPADPGAELPLGGKAPAATQQSTSKPTAATLPTTLASTQPTPIMLDGNFPVTYRQFSKARIGNSQILRLKGLKFRGRWAVIVSGEDLSTGLVGQQVDGIYGYTPACATEIVRRIVLNTTAAAR